MGEQLLGQAAQSAYQTWGLVGLATVLFMVGTITAGLWAGSLLLFRSAVLTLGRKQDNIIRQQSVIMDQAQSIINAAADMQRTATEHTRSLGQIVVIMDKLRESIDEANKARAQELMSIIHHMSTVIGGQRGNAAPGAR